MKKCQKIEGIFQDFLLEMVKVKRIQRKVNCIVISICLTNMVNNMLSF